MDGPARMIHYNFQNIFANSSVETKKLLNLKYVMMDQMIMKDANLVAQQCILYGVVLQEILQLHQSVLLFVVMASLLEMRSAMMGFKTITRDARMIAQVTLMDGNALEDLNQNRPFVISYVVMERLLYLKFVTMEAMIIKDVQVDA